VTLLIVLSWLWVSEARLPFFFFFFFELPMMAGSPTSRPVESRHLRECQLTGWTNPSEGPQWKCEISGFTQSLLFASWNQSSDWNHLLSLCDWWVWKSHLNPPIFTTRSLDEFSNDFRSQTLWWFWIFEKVTKLGK
jgi:hypothetical protein